jgi:prepilin signal peptidase PulO-like enzyme (type II secretory pathway)
LPSGADARSRASHQHDRKHPRVHRVPCHWPETPRSTPQQSGADAARMRDGDAKLAGVAGVWLDWTVLPIALEIAVLGTLTAVLVYQLIARQRLKSTTRLPFGLFLAPAIWMGWLIQTGLPWPGP